MAKFKLIVSDPSTGKSSVSEVEGARAQALIGRSLGEVIDGSVLGITHGKALISGGCDKNGIPMRADVHGGAKKYIVLSSGPGFRSTRHGERRRKLIRGRIISDETFQINFRLQKDAETLEKPTAAQPTTEPSPMVEKKSKPEETATKKAKETKKPSKKGK
ncbi:MAG: 30S ribosomal protein S6e [Candidatus Bathyarchaeia archaeon]|jgi:small subunit ribosomal protein S6e